MILGSDKSILFLFPVDLPMSNKVKVESTHAIPNCHNPVCLGLFDITTKPCEGIV